MLASLCFVRGLAVSDRVTAETLHKHGSPIQDTCMFSMRAIFLNCSLSVFSNEIFHNKFNSPKWSVYSCIWDKDFRINLRCGKKCHLTTPCKTSRMKWRHDFLCITLIQKCIFSSPEHEVGPGFADTWSNCLLTQYLGQILIWVMSGKRLSHQVTS